jgi:hypothetical protein
MSEEPGPARRSFTGGVSGSLEHQFGIVSSGDVGT